MVRLIGVVSQVPGAGHESLNAGRDIWLDIKRVVAQDIIRWEMEQGSLIWWRSE